MADLTAPANTPRAADRHHGPPHPRVGEGAAIASLALAGLMLILTVLGIVHLRRVDPEAEILPTPTKAKTLKPVTA